jgi:hypothetical protein
MDGGCGVAHTAAHTTLVRKDMGLILHPNPGWLLESPISLLSDNRLKNNVIF